MKMVQFNKQHDFFNMKIGKKTRPLSLAISLALINGMVSSSVLAADEKEAEKQEGLERILVTATRKGITDVQTTPIAITAITSNYIEESMPNDTGDLAAKVPNFTAARAPGFNAASLGMRGVSTTSVVIYQDPQIGVIVDDFVMPSLQTQLLETFDIESVEVLRGPQGTLFGKNTTGGVLNIKTKMPQMGEKEIEARFRVASFGRKEGRVAINFGGEELAFRGSLVRIKSDGYYRNGATYGPLTIAENHPLNGSSGKGDGRDLGGQDSLSGRFKLLWEPNDNYSAVIQYEMMRDEGDSFPVVNTTPNDSDYVFAGFGFNAATGDPLDHAGITTYDQPDKKININDGHIVDVDGYYVNQKLELDGYTLYSSTGWRNQYSNLPSTYGGEIVPLYDAARVDERETFQQEIRLATNWDSSFNMAAGAFYQKDETTFCVSADVSFVDMQFGLYPLYTDGPTIQCNRQNASSWAIFVDGTWDVTEKFSLGAGFRFTDEEKDWIGYASAFYPVVTGGKSANDYDHILDLARFDEFANNVNVLADEQDWQEPTWRLTAGYQFTDDIFAYFTYARGFKSGGYGDTTGNAGVITPESIRPTDPEKANSYELGIKTTSLNNRLRANLTGFHVKYSDAQREVVTKLNGFQETRFQNAANLTAYGLEAEVTYQVTSDFTLSANLGYLNAEYDDFLAILNDSIGLENLSGRDVSRSPELQWNIDASYTHDFIGGTLTWIGNVNFEDESLYTYAPLGEQYDGRIGDRTLVNANVTYRNNDDTYFARVYGKNLTDERYKTGHLPVSNLWEFSAYGEPRVIGAEFGLRF